MTTRPYSDRNATTARPLLRLCLALLALVFEHPTAAQNSGAGSPQRGSGTHVSGFVIDVNGQRIPDAFVMLQPLDHPGNLSTRTDARGTFFVRWLAPGEYLLSASSGDLFSAPVAVTLPTDDTLYRNLTLSTRRTAAGTTEPVSPTIAAQDRPSVPPPVPSREQRDEARRQSRVMTVLRDEGIHAAAIANGGTLTVGTTSVHTRGLARDLSTLSGDSDLVVIGIVRDQTSRVALSPIEIVSYCTLEIVETLKGNGAVTVPVRMLGGVVRFPDGVVAEQYSPFNLVAGGRYLLYLRKIADGEGADLQAYAPLLGPQGVFDITSPEVKSMARPTDPVFKVYAGKSVEPLLEAARSATRP